MIGFTAKEFEPDAASATASDDTTGGANGKDGNTAAPANNGQDTEPWPVLDAAAYHGLAGEVVCTMAPQTEADPVALLLQLLVYSGNAISRGPYCLVGKDRHFTNLFGMLAGKTGKARKGLSAGHIRDYMENVDPEWAEHRVRNGMSSGEGLIFHVRDPISAFRKGEMKVVDPGVPDKRVLLNEQEFFSVLAVMQRLGNTLSGVVRKAWDCAPVLETLVKKDPNRASKAFISIVGHITIDELRGSLDHTSMANGYANRFLFACVDRSKELPLGGDEVDLSELIERTRVVVDTARAVERVMLNDSAKALWCGIYSELSTGQPGMLGAITARGEAQTLRLSLIYALLDGAREIDRVHVEAGLAMWNYCKASARYIFGDLLGNTAADAILRALRTAGANGMSRTDISDVFGHNRDSGKITSALELLITSGKARFEKTAASGRRGRPKETWYAI